MACLLLQYSYDRVGVIKDRRNRTHDVSENATRYQHLQHYEELLARGSRQHVSVANRRHRCDRPVERAYVLHRWRFMHEVAAF